MRHRITRIDRGESVHWQPVLAVELRADIEEQGPTKEALPPFCQTGSENRGGQLIRGSLPAGCWHVGVDCLDREASERTLRILHDDPREFHMALIDCERSGDRAYKCSVGSTSRRSRMSAHPGSQD